MKTKMMLAALALTLLSVAPNLRAACTNATMLGNWGFTGTGVVILPTGAVPVGQDRSLGGGEQHEVFSGTYTITGDCALTLTTNVYDDSGTLQRTTVLK